MKLLIKMIVSCLLVANIIYAQQASSFSKKGSRWFGGGFNYSSIGIENDNDRVSLLQISPILRFFPADHFMLGPSLSYTGIFEGNHSLSQTGLGLEIGTILDGNGVLFPYFRSGGSLVILGGSGFDAKAGFALPLGFGLIIPAGNIFAVQIELGYSMLWIDKASMNIFNISFGVGGIGEKSAITVIQGISGRTSLF